MSWLKNHTRWGKFGLPFGDIKNLGCSGNTKFEIVSTGRLWGAYPEVLRTFLEKLFFLGGSCYRPFWRKNIARVRNCLDITILNSLFGLCLLSFCLFAFVFFVFFVFLSFCLDITLIKCLIVLKCQKSLYVSTFKSGTQ